MQNWQKRTALLIGEDGVGRLERARVAILGLGGVGSAAAEALCRAGVGHLLLIDHDTVDETNLNRQLVATRPVIGMPKTQAALLRLRAIRPDGDFMPAEQFYLPDNSTFLFEWQPDYVIDAIDTVTAKLHLAGACAAHGVPLLMCLGTGNRLDPSALRAGDIADQAGHGGAFQIGLPQRARPPRPRKHRVCTARRRDADGFPRGARSARVITAGAYETPNK